MIRSYPVPGRENFLRTTVFKFKSYKIIIILIIDEKLHLILAFKIFLLASSSCSSLLLLKTILFTRVAGL